MKPYEQNKAQSERETRLAVRDAHRSAMTAVEWFGSWKNRLPTWIGEDLLTVEIKLRKINEALDMDDGFEEHMVIGLDPDAPGNELRPIERVLKIENLD